jgi:hypothetical protein
VQYFHRGLLEPALVDRRQHWWKILGSRHLLVFGIIPWWRILVFYSRHHAVLISLGITTALGVRHHARLRNRHHATSPLASCSFKITTPLDSGRSALFWSCTVRTEFSDEWGWQTPIREIRTKILRKVKIDLNYRKIRIRRDNPD